MAWRIFAVLCAAYLSSQFFRVSNAVIAPELMRELALSPAVLGTMTGAFFLTFAAAQVPAGVLLDRWGPRRTMAATMMAAVAGSLVFAAADSALVLTLGRALMGLGCAVGLMGALLVIGRWFPPERFAPLSSLLFAVGGAGTLLATTPLALAADGIGWRGAFVVMAGVTALLAALVLAVVRDAPPPDPVAGPTARRAAGAAAGSAAGSDRVASGLAAVLGNTRLRRIAALQFVAYGSLMTVAGLWAGPYLEEVHGLGAVGRGNVLLGINLAVIAGALGFGWAAPRFSSPKRLAVPGAAVVVLLFGLLAALPAPPLWLAAAALLLLGLASGYFMLLHAHARAVLPAHLLGRGLTLQNTASILGVFLWQAATGLIVEAFAGPGGAPEIAYRAVFAFLGAISLVGLLVYTGCEDGTGQDDAAIGRPHDRRG
ncbi:MAG: MFS transporter [Alphaproteobacteria bacterium]